MSDSNQQVKYPEGTSYVPVPDYLNNSVKYWELAGIMKPYRTGTIIAVVIFSLFICFALLGSNDPKSDIHKWPFIFQTGVLICGGSFSKKKVPDVISTCIWGLYSLVVGMALAKSPAILGYEEFPNRVLMLAVPFISVGIFLLWVAFKYIQNISVKILFNQVIGFSIFAFIIIVTLIAYIIRIAVDPQLELVLLADKDIILSIFMGLWLISLSSICFSFYRRFEGEVTEPSEDDVSLTERMIQEVKTSKGKQKQDIIQIIGYGPAWIGKLWADSIFFVIDNSNDPEEFYLIRKSDFKLKKCLTSKKKRASGFLNVIFKVNGEKYKGEMSGESYHRYEKWKGVL